MNIVIEFPEKLTEAIWKKLLMCGIEKVDGLLCKHSFRLLSHYICVLSLLMHFVKHLSTSIMSFNNTFPRGGGWGMGGGVKKVPREAAIPPAPPPPPQMKPCSRNAVYTSRGSVADFRSTWNMGR